MGLLQLLFSNPVLFITVATALLYSIIFHEVAHGWVAHLFGDDTAQRYGRITLNPVPHIDPVGAAMLLFVGFGWAKPVPVNYDALKTSRFGIISVALAGCLTNLLIAFVAILALQFNFINASPQAVSALSIIARINIILAAFNLIPIPPLDGSKILMSFLPLGTQENLARIEPYGFFILAFFLFTGLLNPVITFMQNGIYGFILMIVGFVK